MACYGCIYWLLGSRCSYPVNTLLRSWMHFEQDDGNLGQALFWTSFFFSSSSSWFTLAQCPAVVSSTESDLRMRERNPDGSAWSLQTRLQRGHLVKGSEGQTRTFLQVHARIIIITRKLKCIVQLLNSDHSKIYSGNRQGRFRVLLQILKGLTSRLAHIHTRDLDSFLARSLDTLYSCTSREGWTRESSIWVYFCSHFACLLQSIPSTSTPSSFLQTLVLADCDRGRHHNLDAPHAIMPWSSVFPHGVWWQRIRGNIPVDAHYSTGEKRQISSALSLVHTADADAPSRQLFLQPIHVKSWLFDHADNNQSPFLPAIHGLS